MAARTAERFGPKVKVVVEYRCDGCAFLTGVEANPDGFACAQPQIVQGHNGHAQFVGFSGPVPRAPEWCPYRESGS